MQKGQNVEDQNIERLKRRKQKYRKTETWKTVIAHDLE